MRPNFPSMFFLCVICRECQGLRLSSRKGLKGQLRELQGRSGYVLLGTCAGKGSDLSAGEVQGRSRDAVPGTYTRAEPARECQLALRHRRPRARCPAAQVLVLHTLRFVASRLKVYVGTHSRI